MNNKLIKKIGGIFLDILIGFVIVFALIISIISITTTKDGIPRVFGYSPFTIQSNSMYPLFKKGDLIIVREYNGEVLKENDIVSFFASENTAKIIKTHRIVNVSTDMGIYMYTTKGDNNDVEDDVQITDTDIVGVYQDKMIPKVGYLLDFLKSTYGFLFCVILPLGIIFIKQMVDLFKIMLDKRLEEEI